MFKGRRDPEIGIVVTQDSCRNYTAKSGGSFIEVPVPPESVADYTSDWGTIMVDKKQIDNLDEFGQYNFVRVNNWADIVVSVKDKNHAVISSETLKPIQIIGRLLKFYRWQEFNSTHPELADELDRPSLDLYNDMVTTGQDMLSYMNRLPKALPVVYTLEDCVPDDGGFTIP